MNGVEITNSNPSYNSEGGDDDDDGDGRTKNYNDLLEFSGSSLLLFWMVWRWLGFSSPRGTFMKVACIDEEGPWALQTTAQMSTYGRIKCCLSLWCTY